MQFMQMRKLKPFLDSYGTAKASFTFGKDFLSFLGFLFPWAFGIFGQNTARQTFIDVSAMSMPVRLGATLAVAVVLGAGLGFATSRLTRRDTHLTMWAGGILAGAWAILLIIAVDSFSGGPTGTPWPEFSLFLILSLGLSVLLLTKHLSAGLEVVSRDRVVDRSSVVLIYVGVAIATALLVRVGDLV